MWYWYNLLLEKIGKMSIRFTRLYYKIVNYFLKCENGYLRGKRYRYLKKWRMERGEL